MKWTRILCVLVSLSAGSCIYAPKLVDCKVKCAEDKSCPANTTCDNGFCRPSAADGFCACSPGEERACGGGQGECLAGVQRCAETKTWGVCLGEVKPTVEICDNKDNNCNGIVDDDPSDAPPCGKTLGVCYGKVQQCVNGSYSGYCMDAEYGPDYQPIETRCDNKDNDCDGFVDGKAPTHLVDTSTSYALAGLDGGYALAWADQIGTNQYVISARLFDGALRPLGAAVTLGLADGGVLMHATGFGNRAYFTWEDEVLYNVDGRYIDLAAPALVMPLQGMPRADATGSPRYGANGGAFLGAYPSDGGLGILEWPTDGGNLTARVYRPTKPDFIDVQYVNVSSKASTISYTMNYYTDLDAGSTSSDDVIMAPDGTRFVTGRYVWNGAAFLDLRSGKVSEEYWGSCNYSIFFYSCVKSYLSVNFDLYAATNTLADVRVLSDSTAIADSAATATPNDWALSWVESSRLYIATPVPAARGIRFRNVDLDGGIATQIRMANSGGDFNALVYNSNISIGALDAVLSCAP